MSKKFDKRKLRKDEKQLLELWGSDDCWFDEKEIAEVFGITIEEFGNRLNDIMENDLEAYKFYRKRRNNFRKNNRFNDRTMLKKGSDYWDETVAWDRASEFIHNDTNTKNYYINKSIKKNVDDSSKYSEDNR